MTGMTEIRRRTVQGLRPGDRLELSRTFTAEDVAQFGLLSRDHNPVHDDAAFARSKGFHGIICHGLLVGALLTEIGGQIGWLATRLDFSFKRPVYAADTVTCVLEILAVDERLFSTAEARFVNQLGIEVARARLEGYLPNEYERRLMDGDAENPGPERADGQGRR